MPTISVNRLKLFEILGKTYTDQEFDELCFEFGIELDEVTTENAMKSKETGKDVEVDTSSADIIYRIDVPANRYDILCLEGLSRALLIFLGKMKAPIYTSVNPSSGPLHQVIVKPETAAIRPFVVAAILRNITFDQVSYQSFIDLQEKLHQNVCRKRTLVAIGTHDLDTLEGPFTYEALPPQQIVFKPLNQQKEMNGDELMAHYTSDNNIKKYLHIIKDSPVYPVIYDAKRRVLSLPPIINGDHSKIKLTTRNVLIECTATDLTKGKIVLNTMLTMFSQYTSTPFITENVEVVSADGSKTIYPDFTYNELTADVDYINKAIGIKIAPQEVSTLLDRMGLHARLSDDLSKVHVKVPPTRSDILHACDIMEDVAVAYGFNKVVHTVPKTNTVAAQLPINKLSDLLRREVALAGYTEVLTFALCSVSENFDMVNKVDDGSTAVTIANPKTVDFQLVRTSLLPGILKTVANNRQMSLPIKVFEISDVVLKDSSKDVGARNERHLAALYYANTAVFELIHGLLDRVMQMMAIPFAKGSNKGYRIRPADNPTYFPDRCAEIIYNDQVIGIMGIVHPEVSKRFDLQAPCTAIEINIEPFL